MAHYKRDAASNRDALFGGSGGGGGGGGAPGRKSSARSQPRPAAASTPRKSASATATAAATGPLPSASPYASKSDPTVTPGPSSIFTNSARIARNAPISLLTGQAKIAKMAEAEDYRLKAKKAMTRGIFSKPDPISAANFYKRAADAYKQCGENRLERLHRIASGDCQLGQDAYATAAAEYTRAAELAEGATEETLARKRQECHKLHLDAASAWSQMGERGRAAESTMKAAFGLVMGEDAKKPLDAKALKSVEDAIESFVGDPLNRKRNYRRTGTSAYEGPGQSSDQSRELAKQNVITDSYAHETLFKCGAELIRRRHYESALYAHGAGTAALEHEGYATVSLSRAYLSECVLTLAMGDAVAASEDFRNVHLQKTSYLSSRECALEEDLIRACDAMDGEALDEARGRGGPHRAALANLDPGLRELVGEIRVSGRAKKEAKKAAVPKGAAAPAAVAKKPPPPREKTAEEVARDTDAGFAEMDDIMNQMGLGDDDSDSDIDLT